MITVHPYCFRTIRTVGSEWLLRVSPLLCQFNQPFTNLMLQGGTPKAWQSLEYKVLL